VTDDIALFMLEKVLKLITMFFFLSFFLSSFPSVAKQPNSGSRHLIVEVSRSHTIENKKKAYSTQLVQVLGIIEREKHNRRR